MEISTHLSTYDFITNYLSESVPLSFKNHSNSLEAQNKWTDEYLNTEVGNTKINVSRYEHKQSDHLKKFIEINNYTANKYLNELLNKTDTIFDYFWNDFLPEKLTQDVKIPDFMSFLDLKYTKIWKVIN